MFPGMDPRAVKQAMKKMGVTQEDIPAVEVVIKCKDKEIIISQPSVAKIKMMGEENFQISGRISVRQLNTLVELTEDDIATVMEQASVDRDTAYKALAFAKGDIAAAIIGLKK